MMSLQAIKDLSQGAAIRAAHAKRVPLVIEREDADSRDRLFQALQRIPNLGSYVPEGWSEVQRYLVDSSGWSDPQELASHGCFSLEGLMDEVKIGRGYAIVEEGQFQVKVGEFVKINPKDRR